jgi:hypothetical protein
MDDNFCWDHSTRFTDLDHLEAVCERVAEDILGMQEFPSRIELSSLRYSGAYGVGFVNRLLIKGGIDVRVHEAADFGRGNSDSHNGTKFYDLDSLVRDYVKSLKVSPPPAP